MWRKEALEGRWWSRSGATDATLSAMCQQEGRALLTLDFADIRSYRPASLSGVIVLRLSRQDKQHVLDVVRQLLPVLEQEPVVGQLWIVEEERIRVRE